MTTFRPGILDDVDGYLALRRTVFPYQVNTAAGMRHFWANVPEKEQLRLFAAERDGKIVGFARCGLNTWSSEPGAATMVLVVAAEHRGQGIGSELLARVEAHLRDVGGVRVQGWSADDEATIRWLGARGFTTGHELRYSAARTDQLPPMPELPPGVTTATFAEVGPEAVFAVDSISTLDEPNDIPVDVIEYDQWLTHAWNAPELRHDVSVAVLVDGVPAAVTWLEADLETGRGWSGGTGTLPAYRGRGLAKIAKSVSLRMGAELGITMAYTSNDEVNKPMLAINEWLGYCQVATQWSHVKTLS